ncbi:hypothetical protein Ae168Ps1_2455c [Pseudonocardia sp. Ae168_Ps1]|uniref:anti-sigma-D factor RsdA n=1 Tax=unclassified Pseudonocardia TaxID=2619320 RepID=UPI00094B6E1B|nr:MULTISPECIES: anti-sigma-D factor RsdA [unclassified Pseudonocardia]OLL74072.1 hypothetical protein Ae150APs1_2450c [Pseudonocardia sp. Ae150A_Ps1]OLL80049.1 hypothetical protein Ae168Ps1_2455c [Pseudonocardia sp. Ae168_Ps1]OLL85819.1 hypothetical protein Ae263Ps1_2874 [Pseudonocardia sp. Ae263_Ps1]OLL94151.1 hypothetical protein Ae356Ps1_4048c [Pseudonocardia sp. Ae356_Ps1]
MRDQDPYGPGRPPRPGDGQERPPAPVTRGRFGEPRPGPQGGRPPSGQNGHRGGQPVGRPFADQPELDDEGPVDLVELQADDELINALSSGLGVSGPGNRGYDVDDRLVALLSTWKDDVDREPVPELVGTDEAVEMLQPAKPSRKVSFLRPLVAAAAVAACALAVVSIGAHEAQPGDALWGVSRVLYSERAEQVQAATDLRTGIERVNAKLASGDTVGAQQDLAALGPLLDRTDPEQRDDFEQQNRFLTQKVAESPAGVPTDPRAPLRDGTPAPPSSEGRPEPQQPVSPRPESGTSNPGGSSSGGSTSPDGSSSPEGSSDPRVLQGPGTGSPSPSTTTSPSPSETSPTTEGSADPSTTSTSPTASGEGGRSESDRDTPSSSTSTGAVSSSPN